MLRKNQHYNFCLNEGCKCILSLIAYKGCCECAEPPFYLLKGLAKKRFSSVYNSFNYLLEPKVIGTSLQMTYCLSKWPQVSYENMEIW